MDRPSVLLLPPPARRTHSCIVLRLSGQLGYSAFQVGDRQRVGVALGVGVPGNVADTQRAKQALARELECHDPRSLLEDGRDD